MKDVLTIMGLGFSDLHIFGERSVFIGGTGGGGGGSWRLREGLTNTFNVDAGFRTQKRLKFSKINPE